MAQTMKDILNRMLNHEELSREEMKNILIGITQSEFPTEQITALLTALQMRGVTVDELLGFGAWYKHRWSYSKGVAVESCFSKDVLQRLVTEQSGNDLVKSIGEEGWQFLVVAHHDIDGLPQQHFLKDYSGHALYLARVVDRP